MTNNEAGVYYIVLQYQCRADVQIANTKDES
jgi:hypothetical protein